MILMKAVRVQYAVKPGYAETNKRNIPRGMDDLLKITNPGIKYSAHGLGDGKSFVHLGICSV